MTIAERPPIANLSSRQYGYVNEPSQHRGIFSVRKAAAWRAKEEGACHLCGSNIARGDWFTRKDLPREYHPDGSFTIAAGVSLCLRCRPLHKTKRDAADAPKSLVSEFITASLAGRPEMSEPTTSSRITWPAAATRRVTPLLTTRTARLSGAASKTHLQRGDRPATWCGLILDHLRPWIYANDIASADCERCISIVTYQVNELEERDPFELDNWDEYLRHREESARP